MGRYRFNPIVRSGFEKVDDASSVIVIKDDGTEISVTEFFNQIVRQLGDKLDADSLPSYSIEVVDTEEGYLKSYQLSQTIRGVTTLLPHKINIPRDFFLRNVEVVVVDDDHPIEGLDNGRYFKFTFAVDGDTERTQMLPVDTLRPCTLTAGDHIHIEGEVAEAHSFVPQYDSVDKVLPHEMQFQYTGDTTEDGKWVKDFFYRKKLVSQQVTDITTYQLPANTRYIEILKDGYGAPMGRYYLIEDYKYVDELKAKYSEIDFFVTQYSKKQLGSDGVRYNSSSPDILKIGDYVWDYDNRYDRHRIVATTGTFNDTFILDNGASITYRGAGGSGNDIEAYVNSDGVMIFYSLGMSLVATELREYYGKLYSYNEGLVVYGENEQYYAAYTKEPISLTVTYTYGEDIYDWQQANVQPQGIPAELEDKIHDQNTDTQLKDGAVKVTDTEVAINKPLMAGRYGTNDGTKALTIGNGTSATDKSNATTIDLNGNIQTIGDVATPTHSLNNTLQGKVCTFEEMMQHYTAGNGMVYMIIE